MRVSAGRVEVYSDYGPRSSAWATLCDAGWNSDIASVVCRQLGFDGVQRFYSSLSSTRRRSIIRLNRCNSNTGRLFDIVHDMEKLFRHHVNLM